jgi:nitrate reductase (cytochrome), electron transfer subunit
MSFFTESPDGRALHVFLAVVVALATIGYFVGTRPGVFVEVKRIGFGSAERPDHKVIAARTYSELMERPFESNVHWKQALAERAAERPEPHEPFERTPSAHARALEERAQNRAYAGAPPTIPHAVRQTGATECMVCHGEGLRIDGKLATPMSHEFMTNCTQCHVVSESPFPFAETNYDALPLNNAFAGLAGFSGGEPAFETAPPQIPHPTFMRSDCTSCHGTMAREGLRTTHPWRQSCTQCHAASATLEQKPSSGLAPFWQ